MVLDKWTSTHKPNKDLSNNTYHNHTCKYMFRNTKEKGINLRILTLTT